MKLKIIFICLYLLLFMNCHRVKEEKQDNNISKKGFSKIPKILDTCWIFIEDKKFFIGEDMDDIKHKIEIHLSPVGDDDIYETSLDDKKFSKIDLIRNISWTFKNHKLQTVIYSLSANINENYNNSEKNFRDYYKYINAIKSKNKCISEIKEPSSVFASVRYVDFTWK